MSEATEGQHLFEYNIYRKPKVLQSDDDGFTAQGEQVVHSIIYGYSGVLWVSSRTQLTYARATLSPAEPVTTGTENVSTIKLDLQQNFTESMMFRQWILTESTDAPNKEATTEVGVGITMLF